MTFLLIIAYANNFKNLKHNSDSVVDSIRVIKLENSRAVIFPAKYTEELFSHSNHLGHFTPDEKTIKHIDDNLAPNLYFLTNSFQNKDPKFQILKENVKSYDKQFLGYVSAENDSIILGQLFNFESDPDQFNKRLEKEFINPNRNNWLKTNSFLFKFSKQSKKFISAYE